MANFDAQGLLDSIEASGKLADFNQARLNRILTGGAGGGRISKHLLSSGRVRGSAAPTPRRPDVQPGRPDVNDGLSREQITQVYMLNKNQLRYCYEVELQRNPTLEGRVDVAWRVKPNGSVGTVRIKKTTLNNAGVEGCILRQVRNWKFPQPNGGKAVEVEYPFIFKAP